MKLHKAYNTGMTEQNNAWILGTMEEAENSSASCAAKKW